MSQRTITLSPDGRFLLITSEYNDQVRLAIKSVKGAAWDGRQRVWVVPVEYRARLLEHLAPFDFEVAPTAREVGSAGAEPTPDPTLSVSRVNSLIAGALARRFRRPVWVRGELASFDRGAGRVHWYFELVEKSVRGDDVAARLQVVVFSQKRRVIEAKLAAAEGGVTPADGLQVRLRGQIEYFQRGGRVQLVVDDIDPDFSLGQLALRRREILEALARRGLLDLNRSLPWPDLPLRIGLITAADSDAYHDFVETLSRSPFGFEVLHYAAAVQGQKMQGDVLSALAYFERLSARETGGVDLVVITRGGGARSDLAWFDNLEVGSAVATSPVKVLVGIGHERDRSVLDEIAAAEKTPTAVAERIVAMVANAEERVTRAARALQERTVRFLQLEHQRSALYRTRLKAAATGSVRQAHVRLERCARGLRPQVVMRPLESVKMRRQHLQVRLSTQTRATLQGLHDRLDVLEARRRAADPRAALKRGYAIVHDAAGQLVRTHRDADVGASIEVRLHDGTLQAGVTASEPSHVE